MIKLNLGLLFFFMIFLMIDITIGKTYWIYIDTAIMLWTVVAFLSYVEEGKLK